jgi:hypothetical protein
MRQREVVRKPFRWAVDIMLEAPVTGRRTIHTISTRKAVEFFAIELAQIADGTFHVAVTATTVAEEKPQLLSQEIASERVVSIDDALAVIKAGLI